MSTSLATTFISFLALLLLHHISELVRATSCSYILTTRCMLFECSITRRYSIQICYGLFLSCLVSCYCACVDLEGIEKGKKKPVTLTRFKRMWFFFCFLSSICRFKIANLFNLSYACFECYCLYVVILSLWNNILTLAFWYNKYHWAFVYMIFNRKKKDDDETNNLILISMPFILWRN